MDIEIPGALQIKYKGDNDMNKVLNLPKVEPVAIDDQTIHTFITKRFQDDIELIWCKETKEATIFVEETEVECKYSTKLEAVLTSLKGKDRWQRALILRRIQLQND